MLNQTKEIKETESNIYKTNSWMSASIDLFLSHYAREFENGVALIDSFQKVLLFIRGENGNNSKTRPMSIIQGDFEWNWTKTMEIIKKDKKSFDKKGEIDIMKVVKLKNLLYSY